MRHFAGDVTATGLTFNGGSDGVAALSATMNVVLRSLVADTESSTRSTTPGCLRSPIPPTKAQVRRCEYRSDVVVSPTLVATGGSPAGRSRSTPLMLISAARASAQMPP